MPVNHKLLIRTIVLSVGLVWLSFAGAWAQAPQPLPPPSFAEGWWEKAEQILSGTAPAVTEANALRQTLVTAAATNRADDWWLLVFQSLRDGNWEIYRQTLSGTTATRLTYQAAADTAPRLSPDTSKIVFVSARDGNDELYWMQADGSNQTRLTTSSYNERAPVWSPNGAQIAYVSYERGNADIYLMNADGTNQRTLTREAAQDLFPSWSPDGGQIVFVRATDQEYGKLWVMNADGSNAHAITGDLRYLSHPRWSPDGSSIAFDYDGTKDYFNELGMVNADGSNLRQLTRSGAANTYEEYWMGEWTPDSKQLIYTYIQYNRQGNQLLLFVLRLARFCLTVDQTLCGFTNSISDRDLASDVRTLDPWPPVSAVKPLPTYTRQQDLYISWQASDIGPAGIASITPQMRPAGSAEWTTVYLSSLYTTGTAVYYPQGGKLYFRTQAYDNADNLEAWPSSEQGDAETTLYRWLLAGRLTDARGVGRPQQGLSLQPASVDKIQTDQEGHFVARIPSNGLYLLNNNTPLDLNSDRTRHLYTVPADNLIQNGDFESTALTHWQSSNPAWAELVTNNSASGRQAVRLGRNCSGPCMAQLPVTGLPAHQTTNVVLLPAPDDTLHLFVNQWQQSLFYLQRTPSGVWSQVVPIANGAISTMQAALDGKGEIHLLWQPTTSNAYRMPMHYSKRTTAGSWSTPLDIGTGQNIRLAADAQGGLHLLYLCVAPECSEQGLWHRYRSPAGEWSADTLLEKNSSALYSNYALTVDASGVLYVVWLHNDSQQNSSAIYYRERSATGQWQTTINVSQDLGSAGNGNLQIIVDPEGTSHLFWNSGYYASRPAGGAWSTPTILNSTTGFSANSFPVMDQSGGIHWLTSNDTGAALYYHKALGQPWADPQLSPVSFQNSYVASVAAGATNALYLGSPTYMAGNIDLWATLDATSTMTSTLSQAVTLPSTLHQPTLSFLYALEGGAGKSAFTVQISAGVTTTAAFSTTGNHAWDLGWVDLTPWAGESITVTFAVTQAADEPFLRADLDDIALGSWTTPLPRIITPARVAAGATTTFVITGTNFMATPTVTLGDTPLTNVSRLDENTLQADLPAGLAPGIYDLAVTNPSGAKSVLRTAVLIGQPLYLPLIGK